MASQQQYFKGTYCDRLWHKKDFSVKEIVLIQEVKICLSCDKRFCEGNCEKVVKIK